MPTVDGIVSGLNTTDLITAIVSPQQVTIDTLNSRIAQAEAQKSAVATIKTKLADLSAAVRDMNTEGDFNANTVTSTSTQFTITADSTALPGSYSIQVTQLAAGQISLSGGFDDPDAADLATGTLSVTVGSTTTNITIDSANNNYAEVAAAIDAVDGLAAYVLDTGAATNRYQLVVQGETGADNAFSFDTSALSGGTVPTFTDTQTAVDAHLVVAGATVYLSTNTASGVIPGLTIDLLRVGTTADTAIVERDTTAMQAKIEAVVDAYNAVLDEYDIQTVFNPDAGLKGPLIGDSTTRSAINDVSAALMGSYSLTGLDYRSLAELGIETLQTGRLQFDAAAFQTAYDADPEAVTAYFTHADGPLTTVADRIDDLYLDETNGILTTRESTFEGIISDIEDQVTKAQDRLTSMSELLRTRFNAMEQTLSRIQATGQYVSMLFPTTTSQG